LTAIIPPGDPEHDVHAPYPRRPPVALLLLLSAVATPAFAQTASIEDVEESVIHDPSDKVRVDAALVLGKLRQPAFGARAGGRHEGFVRAVRLSAVRSLD
jgi:hypothetical protein